MILESVENGPLIWPTVEEIGVTRTKKYAELSAAEKIQADYDLKATSTILKDKAMLAKAQEAVQVLDEEQLAFLADPGVLDSQAVQTIIPNNAAFQTEDLDTYDSDCNDVSNAKAVLMANISNYGSDVISEFDSIKKTRISTKKQSDSLIDILNLKSAKNEDLKAQIQDKVFVITSLKNDLRKIKGKEIVDIDAQKPSANTIVPGMFKGIVKQAKAKQPLDNALDFASYPDCSLVQLDSGTTILQGSWGMVTISWEMLLSQEYTTDDWNHLFQPMFDEYFYPPSITVSPVQEATAPRAVDLADSPVSTSIKHDALSTSIPSTQEQEHSLNISQGSSSNMRQTHTLFEHLGRWTKDHPIANVIGDPSCSVSTRKQLQTDAMWCYFDAS
nr:integrase, catalytic region, zinc finger, CCHC-type, peptidase aspartic, catalytic [Tanacetum cinerariifolium]